MFQAVSPNCSLIWGQIWGRMAKLTSQKLKGLPDGRYGDGQGLYLRRRGNSTQWLFRWMKDGVSREITLADGSTSLADARALAAEARKAAKAGKHPTAATGSATGGTTLGAAVEDWISVARHGWRSDSEEGHTRNQLRYHFGHMYDRDITTLTKADVLAVLRKTWDKPAVADRLLSRISQVLRRCVALDLIPTNPADSRLMRDLLPRVRHSQQHHPAVPWDEAPTYWKGFCKRTGAAARALQLIALTAVRSGEARKAEWREFDLSKAVWTIPEARTKTGRALEVPLSHQAVALIKAIPKVSPSLLFPGSIGRPVTDAAVLKEMRLLHDEYSVHGWRSCFRDWGGHHRHDRDLLELSLGHAVGGQVERAYARSSHTELRRPIMQKWADHLCTE
jgi:integrase